MLLIMKIINYIYVYWYFLQNDQVEAWALLLIIAIISIFQNPSLNQVWKVPLQIEKDWLMKVLPLFDTKFLAVYIFITLCIIIYGFLNSCNNEGEKKETIEYC